MISDRAPGGTSLVERRKSSLNPAAPWAVPTTMAYSLDSAGAVMFGAGNSTIKQIPVSPLPAQPLQFVSSSCLRELCNFKCLYFSGWR